MSKAKWHGDTMCKITNMLQGKGKTVYSECMTKELKNIELNGRILGKVNGKLIIRLFIGEKKNKNYLSSPDIVTVKGDKVESIIEIEGGMTPKKYAGIIVATKVAETCYVNARGMEQRPFDVKGAKLYIILPGEGMTANVERTTGEVVGEKGNLSEIKILSLEEFINNIIKDI